MSQFFKANELKCHCDRDDCDAVAMDIGTMMKADGMRREFGEPISVTSASRCRYWNEKENGAEDSQHVHGRALDLRTKSSRHRARLLQLAFKHGFTTVGIAATFIHVDDRDRPPGEQAIFLY